MNIVANSSAVYSEKVLTLHCKHRATKETTVIGRHFV